MSVHLQHEIANLKKQILSLGALVEDDVSQAVRAVAQRDLRLAQGVIDRDSVVDQNEVSIEEECLKILALHQPVANDLRFIIAVLKLNNDLERIGDLAVNIAQRAIFLCGQPRVDIPFDLAEIAEKSQAMLRQSLDALINLDLKLARQVGASDDVVDNLNRQSFELIKGVIRQSTEHLDSLIALLSVSRYLERIADHATNIAEDVIYLVEGRIIRHQH
jgi:phosphate transport system protein